MRKLAYRSLILGLALTLVAGCGPAGPSASVSPTPAVTPQETTHPSTGGLVVEHAGIELQESYPVQARLVVQGTLPTPCHQLEYRVSAPAEDGRIDISLVALPGVEESCDQVITPFEETIPIGNFTQGAFTVWLNGERVDEFHLGGPTPDSISGAGAEGPVYVERTDLLMMESFPVQVVLIVEGQKPTPCHDLRWDVSEPDSDGRIEVELSSSVDPDVMCVQILEAFEARIPIGSFESGSFGVWLNGEHVGDFEL